MPGLRELLRKRKSWFSFLSPSMSPDACFSRCFSQNLRPLPQHRSRPSFALFLFRRGENLPVQGFSIGAERRKKAAPATNCGSGSGVNSVHEKRSSEKNCSACDVRFLPRSSSLVHDDKQQLNLFGIIPSIPLNSLLK